jgi:hypothetical protein
MISEEYKLVARFKFHFFLCLTYSHFYYSSGKGGYLGGIKDISIPHESYANSVLSSTVASVIEDFELASDRLTSSQIQELRSKAKISCNEDKNPDTDYKASQKEPVLFNIINDPCELMKL